MTTRNKANNIARKRTYALRVLVMMRDGVAMRDAVRIAKGARCALVGADGKRIGIYRDNTATRANAFFSLVIGQVFDLVRARGVDEFGQVFETTRALNIASNTKRANALRELLDAVRETSARFSSIAELAEYLTRGGVIVMRNEQHSRASWWIITDNAGALRVTMLYALAGHDGEWRGVAIPLTRVSGDEVEHLDDARAYLFVRACGCPVLVRDYAGTLDELGEDAMSARRLAVRILERHATPRGEFVPSAMRQQLAGNPLITEWEHARDVVDALGGAYWSDDAGAGHPSIL